MQRGSWSEVERAGMGQFVWRYGVLWFGGLYFVTNTLVRWLSNNPDQRYDPTIVTALAIVSFVYSLCVGVGTGVIGWAVVTLIARTTRPAPRDRAMARNGAEGEKISEKSLAAVGNK